MEQRLQLIADNIEGINNHGWKNWQGFASSNQDLTAIKACYDNNLLNAVTAYEQWLDHIMYEQVQGQVFDNLGLTQKIRQLIIARLTQIDKYCQAHKFTIKFWLAHPRGATKNIWSIADNMWKISGDKSVDFNYYTKRMILATINSTSTIYHLKSNDLDKTKKFVDKQLKNLGQITKAKIKVSTLFSTLCNKSS